MVLVEDAGVELTVVEVGTTDIVVFDEFVVEVGTIRVGRTVEALVVGFSCVVVIGVSELVELVIGGVSTGTSLVSVVGSVFPQAETMSRITESTDSMSPMNGCFNRVLPPRKICRVAANA